VHVPSACPSTPPSGTRCTAPQPPFFLHSSPPRVPLFFSKSISPPVQIRAVAFLSPRVPSPFLFPLPSFNMQRSSSPLTVCSRASSGLPCLFPVSLMIFPALEAPPEINLGIGSFDFSGMVCRFPPVRPLNLPLPPFSLPSSQGCSCADKGTSICTSFLFALLPSGAGESPGCPLSPRSVPSFCLFLNASLRLGTNRIRPMHHPSGESVCFVTWLSCRASSKARGTDSLPLLRAPFPP